LHRGKAKYQCLLKQKLMMITNLSSFLVRILYKLGQNE
jgi:hypothetical protein